MKRSGEQSAAPGGAAEDRVSAPPLPEVVCKTGGQADLIAGFRRNSGNRRAIAEKVIAPFQPECGRTYLDLGAHCRITRGAGPIRKSGARIEIGPCSTTNA